MTARDSLICAALVEFLFNGTCQAFSTTEIENLVDEMLESASPPILLRDSDKLTFDKADGGSCYGFFDVVVEGGNGLDHSTPCSNGQWKLRRPAFKKISRISQISNSGSIAFRELQDSAVRPQQHILNVAPNDLSQIIPTLVPGDYVSLSAGELNDVDIQFPANDETVEGPPIVIDAGNRVIVRGRTRFFVSASNISLINFNFSDVGDQAITVTGRGFSLTYSQFDRCGDPKEPQSQCIMLTGDASSANISFNEFVASQSMTLKIRESAGGGGQPVDVRVSYNVFRDFEKLSDNGQEPIQISGRNGGESKTDFAMHIEHNIFYRTNGDREAISFKGEGIHARWNVFYDMDAAPNFRGSGGNEFSENVMMRTRPLRVAGKANRIEKNFIACPLQPFSILISHGSVGYPAATDSMISDNTLVARSALKFTGQEQQVTQFATGNLIENNNFFTDSHFLPILGQSLDDMSLAANTMNTFESWRCRHKSQSR
jgi:hypothetical protein